MTYYGAKELAASFRTVRKNTLLIAEEIPEDKYGFRATSDTRTVAETLTHIALTPRMAQYMHFEPKLMNFDGFNFMKVFQETMAEADKPRTKAEIITLLTEDGERFAQQLETISEADLAHVLVIPSPVPQSRTRFDMLLGVKEHEMHHRAQLMMMERMLGITPHLTRAMQARMAAVQQAAAAQK